jgi:hypothetical protein
MKKLFLFLIPLIAPAQTTKTEEIFNSGSCTVSCMEMFNNDSLVSAYVTCDAKDDRLATLKNHFTVCYDTPKNVYNFLTELEKFCADKSATTTELCGHKVEIDKSTGSRMVKVYNESGLIFHRFSPTLVTTAKTRLHDWAVKNKVNLE